MDEYEVQQALGTLLGQPVATAPAAVGPEAPLTVTPALLTQIERRIAAIDDSPWRAVFESDGDLAIWFHANLARDARRIVVSIEDVPSVNELAAAAFLVASREYCTALIARVRALEAMINATPPQDAGGRA